MTGSKHRLRRTASLLAALALPALGGAVSSSCILDLDGLSGGAPGAPDGGASAPVAWVTGYYVSTDDPANGGGYAVSAIDWDGLTDVAAAFYVPDGAGGWTSSSFPASTAASLVSAAHQKGKRVFASIGGAGSGPAFEGSTSAANLSTFVGAIEGLLMVGYDGIDVDWEGGTLGASQDHALETALLQALRAASPGALLSLTANYENENLLDDLSFYATISPQIDRINLTTYSMSGAWQGWDSWHSSPLHWNGSGATPTGIDTTVMHYLAAGVPAAKLGVGTGFYGQCYTAPVTGPGQALGGSEIAAGDGSMSHANIMAEFWSAAAYHYDTAADVPWLRLSGASTFGCTYVTYEDETSIAAKGAWARAHGLGGAMIWHISDGYVATGETPAEQNPLLEVMRRSFLEE